MHADTPDEQDTSIKLGATKADMWKTLWRFESSLLDLVLSVCHKTAFTRLVRKVCMERMPQNNALKVRDSLATYWKREFLRLFVTTRFKRRTVQGEVSKRRCQSTTRQPSSFGHDRFLTIVLGTSKTWFLSGLAKSQGERNATAKRAARPLPLETLQMSTGPDQYHY